MSDYRFGDDYKLNIYPKDAMGYDGLDMDKVESVEIEWVDFVRKPDDKTRWHELFGTPERAARTLENLFANCNNGFCFAPEPEDATYDAMLELLRSDV